MKHIFSMALMLMIFSTPAFSAIQATPVEYKIDEIIHEGFMVFDDSIAGKRPGIIVVHEWKGISEHVMESSRRLAELGYIAFAADIYGKGVRPADSKEAAATAGSYKKDRPLLRKKILAALEQLKKCEKTDSGNIAAIGYCFGGTTVLELARSGADVAGVVSFHGGLDSPTPDDAKNIKAKVLVLHGAIDPHVPESEVESFKKEMTAGGVDWQLFFYGNAVHSFTSKAAGDDPAKGAAYHELTAERAWSAMKVFFSELFKYNQKPF